MDAEMQQLLDRAGQAMNDGGIEPLDTSRWAWTISTSNTSGREWYWKQMSTGYLPPPVEQPAAPRACVAVLAEGTPNLLGSWSKRCLVAFAKLHAISARSLQAWTLKGRMDVGYAHGFEVRVLDDRWALWCRLVVTSPLAWKLIEKASKLYVRAVDQTKSVELFVDVESTDIPGTLREREGQTGPRAHPARAAYLMPITREQVEFIPAEPDSGSVESFVCA